MKRFLAIGLVLACMVTAADAFAPAKTYQFTGTVKATDADTLTVEKSATETWMFAKDSSTKGTTKVGDKVTVTYRMVATNIEVKPK